MSTLLNNNVAAHRRTHSFKSLKTQRPTLARGPSSPKLSSLGKKRITEVETTPSADEIDADDSDMTFLQYCPTCEKQIAVPNSSILYCSESCRRKDSTYRYTMPSLQSSSTSLSSTYTYSTSPSSTDDCEDQSPSRSTTRIIPLRSPSTLSTFASKPSVLHFAKADLDPTEWKPAEPKPKSLESKPISKSTPAVAVSLGTAIEGSTIPPTLDGASDAGLRPLHHHRASSAASAYLSQFHHPSSTSLHSTRSARPGLTSRTSTSALPLSRTAPSAHVMPAMSAGNSSISNSSDSTGILRTLDDRLDGPRHGGILNPSGRPAGSKGVKSWEPLVKPIFYDSATMKGAAADAKSAGLLEIDYKKKRLSGIVNRVGKGASTCSEEIQGSVAVAGSLSDLLGKDKKVEPVGA